MTDSSTHYFRISEQGPLPSVKEFRPFRAVIVLDGPYSDQWQDDVSRWLVDSGCLYMMAWGPNCSSWDDSVDFAQIQKFLPDEAPDEEFVMTTWHDDETLESVFWFAQFCADQGDVDLKNTLIVHVGHDDREAEFATLFEESFTLAEREPEPEIERQKSKGWLQRLFGN